MNKLEIFTICIVVGCLWLMFSSYDKMYKRRDYLISKGYKCVRGKEDYGPSHGRDSMFLCVKGDHTITVGMGGKSVRGKYKILGEVR